MRKKFDLIRPITLVLAAALILECAVVILAQQNAGVFDLVFFGLPLLKVVAGLLVLAALAVFFLRLAANRELARFVRSVGEAIGSTQTESLLHFPLPVLAADENGEIVWYNDMCRTAVFGEEEWYGRPVSALVGREDEPTQGAARTVNFQNREYSVFAVRSHQPQRSITLYYLVDDTELKHSERLYRLTRPSMLMTVIDTSDDFTPDVRENERSQLLSQVEFQIEQFAADNDGLCVKTDRNAFLLIIEERHMTEIIAKRFEILDRVRALTGQDKQPVTLSIGVSRNVSGFAAGQQEARRALDMAQGRGGDQAAVKTDSGYDFYGGLSKGVERRTKVKTRIVATAMVELIESSSNVIIMGHKFADFDSLGASIGLLGSIWQMGKPAVIAINRGRSLVSSLMARLVENGFENAFYPPNEALELVRENTLLIIVDTHLEHVLESEEIYRACKNVVVIDHHRRMVGYIDNAVIFYHEPYASSASEMVTELVQYFGENIRLTRVLSEALLAGIMLDTKNFVIRAGVRTFEAAAYLRRQGADTVEVRKMFSSTIEAVQRRMQIVAAAEVFHRCAVASTNIVSGDIKLIAPQAADEMLNISGVDASFVLYEYDGGVSISARSMGKINVQVIMEVLGGGGHQTMAAAQLSSSSLEAARQSLLEAIEEYTQKNSVR